MTVLSTVIVSSVINLAAHLRQYFRITVFYYNPNISMEPESRKRVEEQKRLIAEYNALEGKGGDIEYQILIDGRLPFEEVDNIALPRIFEDEKLQFNENGNQYRSEQIERFESLLKKERHSRKRRPCPFVLTKPPLCGTIKALE